MSNYPTVSIILLNWNGWEDTIECLESVYSINYPNYQVIVVDNGSQDNSLQKIEDYAKGILKPNSKFFNYSKDNKPLTIITYSKEESELNSDENKEFFKLPSNRKLFLIKNEYNYGFAEGNNIGIRYCLTSFHPDYVMLLNNDTVVDKDFLDKLVMISESDEMIGIIGPKIYYYEFGGQNDIINFAGGKINWLRYPGYHHIGDGVKDVDSRIHSGIKECDWITGAAIMIKSKFLSYGFLDNNYFFGCEDVDLCMRLKKQGCKIFVNLDSLVWHKIGVSRKKTSSSMLKVYKRDAFTNFKFLKNNSRFYMIIFSLYIPKIIATSLKLLLFPTKEISGPVPKLLNKISKR
ncbi:hypothetical protein BGV40_00015 [Methanosarcina sp. Ant1]|nr:hypothetical protein BGV40_00015 [Methanosarcina sp. Ant1]